jgi:hypothetical protein
VSCERHLPFITLDDQLITENCLNRVRHAAIALSDYCKENDWAGYDPYDALNSRLFAWTPFSRSKVCRIVSTQVLKRLPINIRPLLMIGKEQNPKAIALFLIGALKLTRLGLGGNRELAATMAERLVTLRAKDTPYWAWGYSFPWQTRTVLVPKGYPNLVCTTFAGNALLELYEANADARYLEMAASAAGYLLNELYWEEGDAVGFSYPLPSVKSRVHNANFLGAAFLCRLSKRSGEKRFLEPALKAARYSAAKQHDDGSWDYGESSTQRWADNFHTGYNLCALRSISQYAETSEFESYVRRGFEFYRKNFFREDGSPKYFHNRTYPIDTHCMAQSIITLLMFRDLDETSAGTALSLWEWAMTNMMDDHQGYFYYQALPYFKNKISYMRWSQAWMFLALTVLLEHCAQTATSTQPQRADGQ